MEISWTKTRGKTTTEMGRHQEGLLVSANYKRVEDISSGQEYVEANY
jgi:hypothetical protein